MDEGQLEAFRKKLAAIRSDRIKDVKLSDGLKNEVLDALFGERKDSYQEEINLSILQSRWGELADFLQKHSMPYKVRGGRLVVRVEKSVYAQEVSLYRPHLLKAIREKTGIQIQDIWTQTGRIEWPKNQQVPKKEYSSTPFPKDNNEDEVSLSPAMKDLISGLRKLGSES